MRTKLSERRRRFYRLVREANEMPSGELERLLLDPFSTGSTPLRAITRLGRLAALRILACRDRSGRPYLDRKRNVRQRQLSSQTM